MKKTVFARCLIIGLIVLSSTFASLAQIGPGNAISGNGTTSYASATNSSSLTITNQITVEAWIMRTSMGVQHAIAEKFDCSNGGYALRVAPDDKLYFFTINSCSTVDVAVGTTILQPNIWYHVAGLWDGTSISLYVNGVLDGSIASTRNPKAGTTPLYIGADGTHGTSFNGLIDEVRIWKTNRTQAEISQNMNRTLTGSEANLVAYYRFDESSETTSIDRTTNGNALTFTGGLSKVVSTAPIDIILLPATNITSDSATLNATINPKSTSCVVYFEYGLTTAYGNQTTPGNLNNADWVNFQETISGLSAGTTYHFRFVATTATTTNWTADGTFATPGPPAVVTTGASTVSGNSAVLLGSVFPNSLPTDVYFEYGTTTNYGSFTVTNTLTSSLGNTQSYGSAALNLSPSTTYHFRAVAANSAGVSMGDDLSFTTGVFSSTGIPITGTHNGSAAWADFDHDGDLDFLNAGAFGTQVWRNDGGGAFANINAGFPFLGSGGCAVWGDFNNDNFLDILIAGTTSAVGYQIQVWRNDSGTNFTKLNLALPYTIDSSFAAWGDYNNDGYLDFIFGGYVGAAGQSRITQLWKNNGNETFSLVNVPFPQVNQGSAAWADYDYDGDQDLLLTGSTGFANITQLWRNDGSVLTNINASLPPVSSGTAVWGDCNNDGYLDIAITGYDISAQIWRNVDNTNFVSLNIPFPKLTYSCMAWGDYDNDGFYDIALSGSISGGFATQIWRNQGDNTFTNINVGLPGVTSGGLAWGDYDNDGRLDLLFNGFNGSSSIAQIWRNDSPVPNNSPAAPTNLGSSINGLLANLNWLPTTDPETPAFALTFNVRVGTTPNGTEILSPNADPNSGYYFLRQLGNVQNNWNMYLRLNPGTYYWSVQAIDSAFQGSAFAEEQTFTVLPVLPPTLSILQTNGQVLLQGAGQNGVNYTFQYSTDFTGWSPLTNLPAGADGSFSVMEPIGSTRRFYRLVHP